jgi:hypothetical protein
MAVGLKREVRALDPGVLAAGDGSAADKDEVENVDMGDNPAAAAVGVELGLSLFFVEAALVSVCPIHEANAARCKGRQPCLDSLIPAASGYNCIKSKVNRHTSMKGSSSED